MIKILVTGASGFIGRHLVLQLRQAGHEVFCASSGAGDIADDSTWRNFPDVEVVIHLAGKTFVPDSWANPSFFIRSNLLGTVAALDYCRTRKARLIFLSSYLYGSPQQLPIPETAPLVANNPYALSKKLAEEACQFYGGSFGVDFTILRPFNVYGPGQADSFLIPSIVRQISSGGGITVKDLEPRRDYLYVCDLVDAIVKAVNCHSTCAILNIGTGVSHSVQDLIDIIQGIKNTALPVFCEAVRRKDEIMDTVADISEAKKQLGWSPQWTLLQGVEHMLNEEKP